MSYFNKSVVDERQDLADAEVSRIFEKAKASGLKQKKGALSVSPHLSSDEESRAPRNQIRGQSELRKGQEKKKKNKDVFYGRAKPRDVTDTDETKEDRADDQAQELVSPKKQAQRVPSPKPEQ